MLRRSPPLPRSARPENLRRIPSSDSISATSQRHERDSTTVRIPQPRPGTGALVDRELMPERQDLVPQGEPGPEEAADECDNGA